MPKDPFVGAEGSLRIEAQADESLQILLNVEPGLSGALTVKDFRRARIGDILTTWRSRGTSRTTLSRSASRVIHVRR